MTFVGGGSLLEELKKQVEQRGLADRVKFLGGVDSSEIPEILHSNDVFLSTPVCDGISIALLEAMATGLFPIVSDLKVNSDWIEQDVDGFLYKAGDAEALADCILRVWNNTHFIEDAAQRNRRKVVESGDTKTNMRRLEKIFEELTVKTRRDAL
jgi:glycosyltransferase involved in cell wall biosynthesis